MRISLVTPAPRHARTGNRTTALRWARILRGLGHRVQVSTAWRGENADLLLALHAWRSAASILAFRDRHPARPLVVALTGTDLYRFLDTDPDTTRRALHAADRLVALHDRATDVLPPDLRGRTRIIYQSLPSPGPRLPPLRRAFEVLVVGHLREEKDPFRTALATRDLPPHSRIRVVHLGGVHEPRWADEARAHMTGNPRYRWMGEVPRHRVRRMLRRAPLMVLSSVMEGGANVLSEAIVAGTPVIASEIPGSVGLLGDDYPGYYPPRDTDALRARLLRAESDPPYLELLRRHCAALAPRFTPREEEVRWQALLQELDRVH